MIECNCANVDADECPQHGELTRWPDYEPPTVTLVGNFNDLLGNVPNCGGRE